MMDLINKAIEATKNCYVPYSNFKVGAALKGKSGKIYTGCNIENKAYSPSCCAERTAIFKAISEGEKEFSEIAIVGGITDFDKPCYPCGVCREVLTEFCKDDFLLHFKNENDIETIDLANILPFSFKLEDK